MEVGPSHQGPEHPAGDGSHGGSEQGPAGGEGLDMEL